MYGRNSFKAIMSLDIDFSILWTLAIFKSEYLKKTLITNIILMLGLSFRRVLSFLIDGTPTFRYQFGPFAEILLGLYGCWVLSIKNTNFAKKIICFGKNR